MLIVLSVLRAVPMILFLASYRGKIRTDPVARILFGLALMNLLGAGLVVFLEIGGAPGVLRAGVVGISVFYAVLSWYIYLVFLSYRRQGTHNPTLR